MAVSLRIYLSLCGLALFGISCGDASPTPLTSSDVHVENDYGLTELHIAARSGDTETVLTLIASGADLEAKYERSGSTPLHLASVNGHTETALSLIEAGADVDSRDKTGRTPLDRASYHGHTKTVTALGPVHTTQDIEDDGERDKSQIDHIELVIASEHTAISLQTPEQTLHFIPSLVQFSIVLPGVHTTSQRRNNRNESHLRRQPACLIAGVRAIHHQRRTPTLRTQPLQQLPSRGTVMRLSTGQGEHYGCPIIRGNHMKLGVPSAA